MRHDATGVKVVVKGIEAVVVADISSDAVEPGESSGHSFSGVSGTSKLGKRGVKCSSCPVIS